MIKHNATIAQVEKNHKNSDPTQNCQLHNNVYVKFANITYLKIISHSRTTKAIVAKPQSELHKCIFRCS